MTWIINNEITEDFSRIYFVKCFIQRRISDSQQHLPHVRSSSARDLTIYTCTCILHSVKHPWIKVRRYMKHFWGYLTYWRKLIIPAKYQTLILLQHTETTYNTVFCNSNVLHQLHNLQQIKEIKLIGNFEKRSPKENIYFSSRSFPARQTKKFLNINF